MGAIRRGPGGAGLRAAAGLRRRARQGAQRARRRHLRGLSERSDRRSFARRRARKAESAATCAASVRAALASATMTVRKSVMTASRADELQHMLVMQPAISTVSTPRPRSIVGSALCAGQERGEAIFRHHDVLRRYGKLGPERVQRSAFLQGRQHRRGDLGPQHVVEEEGPARGPKVARTQVATAATRSASARRLMAGTIARAAGTSEGAPSATNAACMSITTRRCAPGRGRGRRGRGRDGPRPHCPIFAPSTPSSTRSRPRSCNCAPPGRGVPPAHLRPRRTVRTGHSWEEMLAMMDAAGTERAFLVATKTGQLGIPGIVAFAVRHRGRGRARASDPLQRPGRDRSDGGHGRRARPGARHA